MECTYGLNSEFDLEMHKKTFVNYLEVIITEDGVVHYAVPSHQEFLIKLLCESRNISREELYAMCPKEYYLDFMVWLCKEAKAVSVWTRNLEFYELNEKQKHRIDILRMHGLYKGPSYLQLGDFSDAAVNDSCYFLSIDEMLDVCENE